MEIILPIKMNLASKDQQFIQLQQLIDSKRKMLLDKQIKYKKILKQKLFFAFFYLCNFKLNRGSATKN